MAGYAEFKRQEGHVLTQVDVQTSDAKLDADLTQDLLKPVRTAKTVGDLHKGIVDAMKALSDLKAFRHCAVTVNPGTLPDTALVSFDFRWLHWWSSSLHLSRTTEGGRLSPSLSFLNLRGRADQTKASLDFKPNTRTWGLRVDHRSPAFIPGKWALGLNYHVRSRLLDLGVKVREKGQYVELVDHDGVTKVRLGRDVRVNYPLIDRAALRTLQSGILTSEHYYFSHEVTSSSLNDRVTPTSGGLLQATNVLTFGHSQVHHTLSLLAQRFLSLHKGLSLELTAAWRWILPWEFSTVHYNDYLRAEFLKGFRAAGERSPPAAGTEAWYGPGDNLGTTNLAYLESKLHFYEAPFLSRLGLSPFLYANLIGVGLDPKTPAKSSFRGSCGLGLDWRTRLGRVEFTYSAKVVSRPGDLPAFFQVLYYD